MKREREMLSPEQMLELWAMRSVGTALTDPTVLATRGRPGIDPERLIALYVELVPGFDVAREALRWVYIAGRKPSDFPLMRPGESYGLALIRRSWGMHLGKAPCRVCEAVVADFTSALAARMADSPFVPPIQEEEPDAETIVAEVESRVGRERR